MRLEALPKRKADFIEPMDCAPVTKLADGPEWIYKIKLDGSEDSQRFLHRSRQGMRKLKVTEKLVGLPPETLNLHVRTVSTAGLSRSSSSGFTIRTSVTLPSGFTMTER